jgi:hypothetical protein
MILLVGRLEARKGINVFCDAIPRILKVFPDTHFVFAGFNTKALPEAGVKEFIMRMAATQHFSHRISILDASPGQVVKLYSACDLFVFPSLSESFGLPVLEAMACGKPVVATAVGIVPELRLASPMGRTVPPGDPFQLASAVIEMLSLAKKGKEHIGLGSRSYVEANFSISAWAENVEGVYKQLVRN